MTELRGKVGVVTGAASGIGRSVAGAFVDQGMRVVLADLATSAVEEEAERLREAGADVIAMPTDVRDPAQVEALAAATVDAYGAVHVLCNNAGIVVRLDCNSWEWPDEVWEQVLAVNLLGFVHGLQAFVPRLLAEPDGGHVVNVAAMAAVTVPFHQAPYCVSKHGVLALSDGLATELALISDKVKVTTVLPGLVKTGMSVPQPGGSPKPGAIEPGVVGQLIVEAILADQAFVFTHPELIAGAEERMARIFAR